MLYDRLIAPLRTEMIANQSTNDAAADTKFATNLEKTAEAYYNANRFLSTFIEHGLKDLDYTVQENTLAQRLLNVERRADCNESMYTCVTNCRGL